MGNLVGSRKDLVQAALESGNLALLDWIQATVDCMIPDRSDAWSWQDPFVIAGRVGKVDSLDWLISNGYLFPKAAQSRAAIISSAILYKQDAVVQWILKNGFAESLSKQDLGEFASTPSTVSLQGAFSSGHANVVEWWMRQSGSLKNAFSLCRGQPSLAEFGNDTGPKQLDALQVWFEAGRAIDFAKCIHEASVKGRVDVLDWLLQSAKAPEDDFVKAWSNDDEFPDEETCGEMYAFFWFDMENHGDSLVWWRANLPHIAALPVNRGPYKNPIHAHFQQHMLKNSSFELLDPRHAIEEYGGLVGLLEYWKKTGGGHKLEDDADRCLTEASEYGQYHVLDWWKSSGLMMKCPEAVLTGETRVRWRAKEWWAKSGLVDESEIARIQVR
ncbi:hypothetical protein BCR44DRAFT_78709 [Catenaria anguillulae PL171]|uniref:Ankyrin repeat-containing domain protein n=1 Tax=Catenaria anguillulae PL171 TaxID=765915 RepID=A0A1Y2HAL3_9FUNG|nr:hypothetical protein BCR44DRAFT_78709 [Catenaria anguillulae PL171]